MFDEHCKVSGLGLVRFRSTEAEREPYPSAVIGLLCRPSSRLSASQTETVRYGWKAGPSVLFLPTKAYVTIINRKSYKKGVMEGPAN